MRPVLTKILFDKILYAKSFLLQNFIIKHVPMITNNKYKGALDILSFRKNTENAIIIRPLEEPV